MSVDSADMQSPMEEAPMTPIEQSNEGEENANVKDPETPDSASEKMEIVRDKLAVVSV